MDQQKLALEDLFEDNGVGLSSVFAFLATEREVYSNCFYNTSVLRLSSAQMDHRRRDIRFLRASARTFALPQHICVISLQILDLTQGWPTFLPVTCTSKNLQVLIAAVYMCVELCSTPQLLGAAAVVPVHNWQDTGFEVPAEGGGGGGGGGGEVVVFLRADHIVRGVGSIWNFSC